VDLANDRWRRQHHVVLVCARTGAIRRGPRDVRQGSNPTEREVEPLAGGSQFNWEYDDGRDKLLALYQRAGKRWDAVHRLVAAHRPQPAGAAAGERADLQVADVQKDQERHEAGASRTT
jgi:hypothetical protein